MVSRTPDATAEKAADGMIPSAAGALITLSGSRNTAKIIVRPSCTLDPDDENRYKSLAYGQILIAQNNGISLARTTEFAQSSGTKKQCVALSILGIREDGREGDQALILPTCEPAHISFLIRRLELIKEGA
jgi:hypothetical protein